MWIMEEPTRNRAREVRYQTGRLNHGRSTGANSLSMQPASHASLSIEAPPTSAREDPTVKRTSQWKRVQRRRSAQAMPFRGRSSNGLRSWNGSSCLMTEVVAVP